MNKSQVIERIKETGVIPVVRASSADEAMRAIDAICAGGVPVLEITMTVPGAVRVIEQVAARYGDEVVTGAGTVLDPETARACILAGAQFIVSPALNVETIACCRRYGVAVMPGALTPTEVVTAWQAGADFVKIFPCNALGGANYIKSLKAPLPQIELIPTGGVNLETAADFMRAGASALGIGSDLVDLKSMRAGQTYIITNRAAQFIQIVKEVRGG